MRHFYTFQRLIIIQENRRRRDCSKMHLKAVDAGKVSIEPRLFRKVIPRNQSSQKTQSSPLVRSLHQKPLPTIFFWLML